MAVEFRPEERLLMECALPPERYSRDRLIAVGHGEMNWAGFVEAAAASRLAALVYARIADAELPVPRPLLLRLAAAHVAAEADVRRLLAERDRVASALRAEGVEALPLKGCALADTLYGGPAIRPLGDLDLLVRGTGMARAASALCALGYRCEGVDPRGETFFYRPAERLFVDVHTDLDPSGRFRIVSDELWRAARPLPPGGAPTLCVGHHLVHALVHAARHRLASMIPLVDAAWMASRWGREIDWETLPALARRWRCAEALAFSLRAASVLFDLEAPPPVQAWIGRAGWRARAIDRIWPRDSPFRSIDSRPRLVRYVFSSLTTSWPSGFTGAARRFGHRRPARPTPAPESNARNR